MLIEFRVTNYRSFHDMQALRLTASSVAEWQATHTFHTKQKAFPRMLRSGVLYGANASGKTNLLRALQFVQAFVLQSAATSAQVSGPAAQPTSEQRILVPPFLFDKATSNKPSEFEVTFVEDEVRYQYGFVVSPERVHREWLVAYPNGRPQRWFERTYNARTKEFSWEFGSKLKGDHNLWRNATRPTVLFLSIAIQLNSEQLKPIFHWFQQRLVIIVANSQFNPMWTFGLLNNPDGQEKLMKFIEAADLGIDKVTVKREQLPAGIVPIAGIPIMGSANGGQGPDVHRFQFLHKVLGSKELVPLEAGDESTGTNKFMQAAGGLLKVLSNGEVLFIDELDNSLHPLMVRFLISLFHSNRTNITNAQLFFTTHDTSLLDGDLFRRDQIWFMEKDKRHSSHLYSLLEFSPRKDEALGRGYLKGRYGALPFIGELRI